MTTRHQREERDSLEVGTTAPPGLYDCVCCGYVLRLETAGRLPTCPADDGLHSLKAWRPGDAADGAADASPSTPKKPR